MKKNKKKVYHHKKKRTTISLTKKEVKDIHTVKNYFYKKNHIHLSFSEVVRFLVNNGLENNKKIDLETRSKMIKAIEKLNTTINIWCRQNINGFSNINQIANAFNILANFEKIPNDYIASLIPFMKKVETMPKVQPPELKYIRKEMLRIWQLPKL